MPHIIEVFNACENLLSQIDSPEIWSTFTSLSKITWTSRNMSGDQGGVGVDIPFKVQIVTNINFLLTFSYTIKSIV